MIQKIKHFLFSKKGYKLKKLLIFLTLLSIASADDGVIKVVYNLTTSNVKSFEQKILKGIAINKAYYEGNLKELSVAVVIHGGAYKFFLKDLKHTQYANDKKLLKIFPDLKKRVASLATTYDVDFMVCGVGLKHRKIDTKNVDNFVKVIPNASIGLIDRQNEGFAYLNVSD